MKCIKNHFKAYCGIIYKYTGISVYWSVDNSLQCIDKLNKLKANSVHTFDFSTLYTNLPLAEIYNSLESLIIKMFKNSGYHYILVNTFSNKAFWAASTLPGYKVFTLDKVLTSLHWILFNTYVCFGHKLFHQTKGIPMGGNCSPLIADIYLSWLEFEYMSKLKNNNFALAKQLSYNSRYIDDILTPNISDFLSIASQIYPTEIPLEGSTSNEMHDYFLDLDINVNNKRFITKIYHKVDLFNFNVISYPFPDSNIPLKIGYNTFLSQLIRFSRICTKVQDFANRTKLISKKLSSRGYEDKFLKKYFIRFCCKMSERVSEYGFYDFRSFYTYCMTYKQDENIVTSNYGVS